MNSAESLPLGYDELRKLAAQKLSRESPGQTLEATALVHEAYLRLVGRQRFYNCPHLDAAWHSISRIVSGSPWWPAIVGQFESDVRHSVTGAGGTQAGAWEESQASTASDPA